MSDLPTDIKIPAALLPKDGRFGSGPSKTRPENLDALAKAATTYMGTSHRKNTVKNVVGRVRTGLSELFSLPDGYEVVLGNGGSTLFWDAATFCLIEQRSQHLAFGEFGSKFASAAKAAPHLAQPTLITSEAGLHPELTPEAGIDAYAFPQNETSTGVSMTVKRPDADGLVLVDATSAAGGLAVDPHQFDAYYFAPQKCFAGDGGLFVAALSPAAQERVKRLTTQRWVPAILDLSIALENSVQNQTYNTPALATIFMLALQVEWMNENGGLAFSAGRSSQSADHLYKWADSHPHAQAFVTDPAMRSNVVATIDFSDNINADWLAATLRSNGIVDTEAYRKLGRNQLRIALFPAIDPEDVVALTQSIDFLIEASA